MPLDAARCYRVLLARDARFDGRFFTGVTSTGIFCRPVCPARTPLEKNCRFYLSAAAALEAGFRPCLRCRPESAPWRAVWRGTASTVSRALALVEAGALDSASLDELADKLGVTARHLRRLFVRHLGAPPLAVAQARRLLLARQLVMDSTLPMGQVAHASGFGSVRRFQDAFLATYGRPPRTLRRAGRAPGATVTLRLPFREPLDWPALLRHLGPRAAPGVEHVDGDTYARLLDVDGQPGWVRVRREGPAHLSAELQLPRWDALPQVVERLRHLFDLGADPAAIAAVLARDPLLAPRLAARPGLRVIGAWNAWECALRVVLGQQVSVAAATTLMGRLVTTYGAPVALAGAPTGLSRRFPTPASLVDAELEKLGIFRGRAAALRGLAKKWAEDPAWLDSAASADGLRERLQTVPGVGPWTAEMVALRSLRDPDAFPAGDLGLRQAVGTRAEPASAPDTVARAERWRPWRAYAAQLLWSVPVSAPVSAAPVTPQVEVKP